MRVAFRQGAAETFLTLGFVFAAGALLAVSNPSPDANYSVAAYASASRLTILVGPLLALWAGYRVARLKTFIRQKNSPRPQVLVWLDAIWQVALLGPLAGVAGMVASTRAFSLDRWTWSILLVTFLVLVAAALAGAVLTFLIPAPIALPLSAISLYVWLAFPTSGGNVLLRHANGSFASCCTIDQRPSSAMLWASSTFALTVILGFALALGWGPRRLVAAAVAVGGMGLGLALSSQVMHAIDSSPGLVAAEPRTSSTVCQTDGPVKLCVWPEHTPHLEVALRTLRTAETQLASKNVPGVIPRFSERQRPGYATVQVADGARPSDYVVSYVQGLLPDPQYCAGNTDPNLDVYALYDRALVWLALTGGLDREDAKAQFEPGVVTDIIRRLDADTDRANSRWIVSAMRQLRVACQAAGHG